MKNITRHRDSWFPRPSLSARRRGVAMVMVMVALAVATIIVLTFLSAQTTSMAIAHNASRQTQARAIAEDAIDLAVEYIRATPEWRDGYTHGVWTADQSLNGGTFRVMFEDTDDSDLGDDVSESFTLTVEAAYAGVSHRVSTQITPTGVPADGPLTVLLVVGSSSISSQDQAKKALFESWGYTVVTVVDNDSQSEYNTAAAGADVAYVSEECYSSDVGTKLNDFFIGIVNEERALQDELGMSSSSGEYSGTAIDITDNTHPITDGFPLGQVEMSSSSNTYIRASGTSASGLTTLAERVSSSNLVLTVLDIGDTMTDSQPSPQRRVTLPWGGNSFNFNNLNANGQTLTRQALEWAAGGYASVSTPSPISRWTLDETTGAVATDSVGGHDGTYNSGPTLGAEGQINTAVQFNGSSSYVEIPHHNDFLIDEGAISFWVYLPDTSGRKVFFSKDSGGRDTGGQITIKAQDRTVTVQLEDTASDHNLTTGNLLSAGLWHHVVCTFGADGLRVYIDGVLGDSDSYTGGLGPSSGGVGNFEPLALGANNWNGSNMSLDNLKDFYDGRLDDVRMYDQQLSAQQVASVYADGVAAASAGGTGTPQLVALYEFIEPDPETPQLVSHWKLDEAIETTGLEVLMVVPNAGSLSSQDSAKQTLIESWGHTVTLLSDESSQSAYDTAADTADVVYISEEVSEPQVDTKLRYSPTGVVIEEHDLGWEFRLSDSYSTTTGTQIDIVNTGHYITSPFSTGNLSITTANITLPERNNDASGMNTLAEAVGWYTTALGTIDFTDTLRDGSGAEGRRVILPWGYSDFDVNLLNSDGQTILRRALEWAAANRVIDETIANHGRFANEPDLGQTGIGDGGTSMGFDGVDQYVEVEHNDAYLLNEGTVSFWFYANDLSGDQGLIAKDATNFGTGGHFRVYLDGSTLECRLQSTSSSHYVSASGVVSANTWHHVAVGFGPGGLRLYVDGVERDTDSHTGGLGTSSGGTGNHEPWTFGVDQWHASSLSSSGWDDPFHGRIDDVRLYDRNLDADQVGDLVALTDPRAVTPATVQDTSAAGTPLDLSIADIDHVTWISGGGLTIDTATTISSSGGVDRLHDALTASETFTVEAQFTPANITQDGPARIVAYSNGTSNRNFQLGQTDQEYNARVRTEFNSSGTPDIDSGNVLTAGTQYHVILTYDGQEVRLYRDGTPEVTEPWTGDLDNWNDSYELLMANEVGGSRSWLGTLHRVAIWDGSVNQVQADNLFNGDPPGAPDGGEEGLEFVVEWLENP